MVNFFEVLGQEDLADVYGEEEEEDVEDLAHERPILPKLTGADFGGGGGGWLALDAADGEGGEGEHEGGAEVEGA